MTTHDYEKIIASYADLPDDVRAVFDPFVSGAEVLEITSGRAHGVVETGVAYLRGGKAHEIIYDETTRKILGGTEPAVIDAVLAVLPASGKARIQQAGALIRKIKIKHDDMDDREYVHVHYLGDGGFITSMKLELDGADKQKLRAA